MHRDRPARLTAATAAVLATMLLAWPVGAASGHRAALDPTQPYRGIGAWVSLYGPQWKDPAAAVNALAAHHVQTLYLETGRTTTPLAIAHPAQVATFIATAHTDGLRIVAWYYPTLQKVGLDSDRILATARLRTPGGQAFDGVALDIEDPSVTSAALRTQRLLDLTARIDLAMPGYPWGAITYPPIGLDLAPTVWPGFPWRQVARHYAAILPMAYWRNRTHTAAGAAWYAAGNMAALHVLTGRADIYVHMIGNGGASAAEALAFATASLGGGAIGVSLYPAENVTAGEWSAISRALPPSGA